VFSDKIQREISAIQRMEFYVMFGSMYQLEHIAYVMYGRWEV